MSESLERLKAVLTDRCAIARERAGGMATLCLARDLWHERRVALIKVLRPDVSTTVGSERFLQEVPVTANLTHPHILPLHDSGEADGLLDFVATDSHGLEIT